MSLKKFFNRKRITSLPKSVADRIAAGEVVDRPISIVKELIENSIDSGADRIILEIKNGGKSYIRVTDNGCGIPAEDVDAAFFRHATNKIETDSDLMSIETLGFRGEALASIAAVTRTQMITKIPEADTGTQITIEGGNIIEKIPVGAADGTTIIVTDLFYNTPAREKFLKKDSTESSLIIDFISKMTLAYPDIRFKLINNDKTLFSTSGKGDVFENIYMVYGKEIASNLFAFEAEEGDMRVRGYISNPVYNKTTRRNQFYFVNGRSVANKILEQSVAMGYGDKMPEGRYPVAYIFLNIAADSLDVNVHPNKKEIRFEEPLKIRDFVQKAIFNALNTELGIGKMSEKTILKNNPENNFTGSPKNIFVNKTVEQESSVQEEMLNFKPGRKSAEKSDKNSFSEVSSASEVSGGSRVSGVSEVSEGSVVSEVLEKRPFVPKTDKVDIINLRGARPGGFMSSANSGANYIKGGIKIEDTKPVKEYEIPARNNSDSYDNSHNYDNADSCENSDSCDNSASYDNADDSSVRMKKFDVSAIEVMGVLFDTYIAARDYKTFYLIDQHAAHERVFYEQFLKAFNKEDAAPQMILAPIIKEIPYYADEDKENWFEFLVKSGFIIESFGGKSYIIRGIPSYMSISEAENFLDDYIDSISESTDFKDQRTLDKIIMKSCKSAVKAHDKLSMDEVNALLASLSETENPFSCPHGRPVIIKMGVSEMEKMFKRV